MIINHYWYLMNNRRKTSAKGRWNPSQRLNTVGNRLYSTSQRKRNLVGDRRVHRQKVGEPTAATYYQWSANLRQVSHAPSSAGVAKEVGPVSWKLARNVWPLIGPRSIATWVSMCNSLLFI